MAMAQRFLRFMADMPAMFDLHDLARALPASNKPLRIAVRQLHWFRAAFEGTAEVCGAKMGCRFAVDDRKLADVFVRWLKAVEAQRPGERAERQEFFDFVPSLVLRELVTDMPLKLTDGAVSSAAGPAAQFWPEAYACLMFCLTVHAAAMDEEFHIHVEVGRMVDDLRSWWSLRENTGVDAAFAAGFFQRLVGHEPNWSMPGNFGARRKPDQF